MVTPMSWLSQGPNNLDVVAPLKARACDALDAVRRSRRRPAAVGLQLMARGTERC